MHQVVVTSSWHNKVSAFHMHKNKLSKLEDQQEWHVDNACSPVHSQVVSCMHCHVIFTQAHLLPDAATLGSCTWPCRACSTKLALQCSMLRTYRLRAAVTSPRRSSRKASPSCTPRFSQADMQASALHFTLSCHTWSQHQ